MKIALGLRELKTISASSSLKIHNEALLKDIDRLSKGYSW